MANIKVTVMWAQTVEIDADLDKIQRGDESEINRVRTEACVLAAEDIFPKARTGTVTDAESDDGTSIVNLIE